MEIKKIKSYASSGIPIRNPGLLRLRNTCARGCAKKTADNVFKHRKTHTLYCQRTMNIFWNSSPVLLKILMKCFTIRNKCVDLPEYFVDVVLAMHNMSVLNSFLYPNNTHEAHALSHLNTYLTFVFTLSAF